MGCHLTLVRQPRKLPNVLNEEEVVRLLEHASGLRYGRRSAWRTEPACAYPTSPT
jgi:hypothetical protein